jgi:hypothetical protein
MFSENPNIIANINNDWGLTLVPTITENELAGLLANRINELIRSDMNVLITALYRIDVDEKKIREMLIKNKETDAALVIAHLVIERQKQKIKTRSMFKPWVDDINEDEKW